MRINRHIINHEIKFMGMGGREGILHKRETTILIFLELLLASISTRFIYPSLEWIGKCI
jgi:hypothetical protein